MGNSAEKIMLWESASTSCFPQGWMSTSWLFTQNKVGYFSTEFTLEATVIQLRFVTCWARFPRQLINSNQTLIWNSSRYKVFPEQRPAMPTMFHLAKWIKSKPPNWCHLSLRGHPGITGEINGNFASDLNVSRIRLLILIWIGTVRQAPAAFKNYDSPLPCSLCSYSYRVGVKYNQIRMVSDWAWFSSALHRVQSFTPGQSESLKLPFWCGSILHPLCRHVNNHIRSRTVENQAW